MLGTHVENAHKLLVDRCFRQRMWIYAWRRYQGNEFYWNCVNVYSPSDIVQDYAVYVLERPDKQKSVKLHYYDFCEYVKRRVRVGIHRNTHHPIRRGGRECE